MDLNEFGQKVELWARARNLVEGTTSEKQFLKLIEEAGEVAECIAKNRHDELASEIGDMLVVLNILANQNGLLLSHCAGEAWNKIKDRKGRMIDGYFVKEADL